MMNLIERLAWWCLRKRKYALTDIYDSWDIVLANRLTPDEDFMQRVLHRHLLYEGLMKALVRLETDLVVDVGSHVGSFGSRLRQFGYQGRIISCEPNPDVYALLKSAADADALWTSAHVGVSAKAGKMILNVTESSSFSSFRARNDYSDATFGELSRVQDQIEVETQPLSDILAAHILATGIQPKSVFLKSDTQGYEREVMAGLGDWKKLVKGLLVEVAVNPIYDNVPSLSEDHAFYEDSGFELANCSPVSRGKNHEIVELDCLYLKRSLATR